MHYQNVCKIVHFATTQKQPFMSLFCKKESELTRLLVMRFSAMGDVAMTVPVIHSLASQNSNIRITVVTRKRFVPMYEWMPANVNVIGIDLDVPQSEVRQQLIYQEHCFTGCTGTNTLRLLPPLCLSRADADTFLAKFERVLSTL